MRRLFAMTVVVAATLALAGVAVAGVEQQLAASTLDVGTCPEGFVGAGCVTDLKLSGGFVVGTITVTQAGGLVTVTISTPGWPLGATALSVTAGEESWANNHTLAEPYPETDSYSFDAVAVFGAGACLHVGVSATRAVVPDLEGFRVSLPEVVTITGSNPGSQGEPSYWDIRVIDRGNEALPNNPAPASPYDGWCVDVGRTWSGGATSANVYSSYEPPPQEAVDHPENMDLLDFVLNTFHPGDSSYCQPEDPLQPPFSDGSTYTYGDIQLGMWYLIDDTTTTNGLGPNSTCHARYIRNQALAWRVANPEQPYVAPCGGAVAVLLVPTGAQQVIVAQVTAIMLPTYCPDPATAEGCLTCCTRGGLRVTKDVNIIRHIPTTTTFQICITGPSFPTTPDCKTFTEGQSAVWSGLETGEYAISESPTGEDGWTVTVEPANVTIQDGAVTTATVTNNFMDCTLTPGYWKTHSEYGPAPYDETWALLPPSGEDSLFYLSGQTWYQVLWTNPSGGNAYYILAHAFIAARLNTLGGLTSIPEVDTALAWSETFFTSHTPSQPLPKPLRAQAIANATILDNFNNGLIGPGHCD
ncbi:MAG: hypothetical protein ACM3O7_12005 [Acidobacteriota bacterium]